MSLLLLLSACAAGSEELVHPGPDAANVTAVVNEAKPISESLPAPVATCVNGLAGWSARENKRPGAPDLPPRGVTPELGSVGGYLDSFTAVCGQKISVRLAAFHRATRVRLRALRIGDYLGRGSRLVWQSQVLVAHRQHEAVPTGRDRFTAEKWPVATTVGVDATWPPGMYLIEIAPVGQGHPSFIPLVVRTSGPRSPYLVLVSDLTWLAYNHYGGASLYFGPGKTRAANRLNRSFVASVDRPLDGSGMPAVFEMNIPLIRFMSRHGLPFDVTTDSSLDATPSQLRGQPTVVVGGHSEYWTKRMYDAAVQARDTGTNFAFLGANEVYWQGRIERDSSGRETALTVYRNSKFDLLAKSSPSVATVQWRTAALHRDPAALVGMGMSAVGVSGPYVVASTPSWLFAGTNLRVGDVLKMAIGNEADSQEPAGAHSPTNLQVVLRGAVFEAHAAKPSLVTAGYYTAPSGAGIFAAGTTFWVCALELACPNNVTPPATSVAIDQITLNLLKAFSVARAGKLNPSVATTYESATQLAGQVGAGSGR